VSNIKQDVETLDVTQIYKESVVRAQGLLEQFEEMKEKDAEQCV
jgi:hypothetical protein